MGISCLSRARSGAPVFSHESLDTARGLAGPREHEEVDPLVIASALGEPVDARLVEPRGARLAEVVTDVVLQRGEEVIRRDGHRVSKRGREGDCVCGEVWNSG